MLQSLKSGLGGTFWGTIACSIDPQDITCEAVNFDGPILRDHKTSSGPSKLISEQAKVIDFVSARRNIKKGAF